MSNPGILTIEQRRNFLEDVTLTAEQIEDARRYLHRHAAIDLTDMILGGGPQ